MYKLKHFVWLIVYLGFGSIPVFPMVIYVNSQGTGDYPTIQEAINVAEPNDVVILYPGTYTGEGNRDIDFLGKTITVQSTDPYNFSVIAETIIDCQGSEAEQHRGFIFQSSETNDSSLCGISITNGWISSCFISGPYFGFLGGGAILIKNSSPSISYCIIRNNTCTNRRCCADCAYYDDPSGAGIWCMWSNAKILNSIFYDNMTLFPSSSYNLYGVGAAIFAENSLENRITIKNCVFSKNVSRSAAIFSSKESSWIINCILWDNDSSDNAPVKTYQPAGWGGAERLNSIANYCILQDLDYIEGEYNFIVDPQFADPDNRDFHLKSQAGRWDPNQLMWVVDQITSPGIDAGNPSDPIGQESFPNGGIVNIGAYGGTTEASRSYFNVAPCKTIIAGDINGDCVVDIADLSFLSLHWMENEKL